MENDLILYTTEDGESQLVLRELSGQVWLTQLEMAELYQTTKQNISKHVKSILSDMELAEEAVVNSKLTTAADGKEYLTQLYALPIASQPNMGLNTFKGAEVRKTDVTTAKNYLTEQEITELNRIVSMWLDFAEDQASRRKQVFLKDWQEKLDQFLQFNDRDVLADAGQISKQQADEKAHTEYERYASAQRQLKEQQGEQDITELLRWQNTYNKKKP